LQLYSAYEALNCLFKLLKETYICQKNNLILKNDYLQDPPTTQKLNEYCPDLPKTGYEKTNERLAEKLAEIKEFTKQALESDLSLVLNAEYEYQELEIKALDQSISNKCLNFNFFDARLYGGVPTYIVFHHTVSKTVQATFEAFCESKTSAHYCIDKNGDIYRFVSPEFRAYHAGKGYSLNQLISDAKR